MYCVLDETINYYLLKAVLLMKLLFWPGDCSKNCVAYLTRAETVALKADERTKHLNAERQAVS